MPWNCRKGLSLKGEGAEEGEIDMRRLQRQIVELAEDIAEADWVVAEDILARQVLDGGGQRVVHHFHAHVSAVVFGGQRHPLQDLQPAPDLADEDARSVDVEFGEHHAAQHVRFQALPVLGAAMGHGEERERARTVGGGVDLGDDGVIIGVVGIVNQPLLPFDVEVLLAGSSLEQGVAPVRTLSRSVPVCSSVQLRVKILPFELSPPARILRRRPASYKPVRWRRRRSYSWDCC